MPYKTNWYIEGEVIEAEIWGEQTVEELQQSNHELIQYLKQADNRLIHILMQDTKLEKIPLNMVELQNVLTYAKHPNLGWVVICGDKEQNIKDKAQEFILQLLARVTRANYLRVKTFDDAINHLKSVDPTINWDAVQSNSNR